MQKDIIMIDVNLFNKSVNKKPRYESSGAAGFDISADLSKIESKVNLKGNDSYCFKIEDGIKKIELFANGGRVLIPSGLHMNIPEGYELQVRPRSGLALKHGISIVNSPGTVDSDYKGDIGVILINTDRSNYTITDGDRIAQGVLNKVEQCNFISVNNIDDLGDSERGQGGFGSTGKN